MKCIHCNQEHPDDFMFCPKTGAKLEPQLKAVETCPECQSDVYEIIGMPSNYLYCPKCEKVLLAVFAVDPDLIEEYRNKI